MLKIEDSEGSVNGPEVSLSTAQRRGGLDGYWNEIHERTKNVYMKKNRKIFETFISVYKVSWLIPPPCLTAVCANLKKESKQFKIPSKKKARTGFNTRIQATASEANQRITCSIPGVSGLNRGRVSMCSGTKWNPYLGIVYQFLRTSSAKCSFELWAFPISSKRRVGALKTRPAMRTLSPLYVGSGTLKSRHSLFKIWVGFSLSVHTL